MKHATFSLQLIPPMGGTQFGNVEMVLPVDTREELISFVKRRFHVIKNVVGLIFLTEQASADRRLSRAAWPSK